MRKIILMLCMILIMSSQVFGAFTCNGNSNPVIQDRIYWTCEDDTNMDYSCVSYIQKGNETFQVNPLHHYNKETGEFVDAFASNSGLVNVYFRGLDLIDGIEASFGVRCSTGTVYELNATPEFKDPTEFFDNTEAYVDNQRDYIFNIMFYFVIALIIGVVVIWIRSQK